MIDLRKTLLAGTAIVAVGAYAIGPAHAADLEPAGAVGTPTALDPAAGGADNIVNAVATNATDDGSVDVNGGEAVTNIDIDNNVQLDIIDSNATTAEALTVSGFLDVTSGQTATIVFGSTVVDGSGTDGATTATVAIAGTAGDAGATTLTRGGVLTLRGADNEEDAPGVLTVGGNTLLTTVNVTAGDGGAAEAGTAVTSTFGDASTDTFDVTGLTVSGGAANAADKAGGAATFTSTGAGTVGTGNLTITGGAGADDALGGAAAATFSSTLTVSGAGTVDITGGNADAGGVGSSDGGAASLTVTGASTIGTGAVTITGGDDAAGDGGDASATFTGAVTSGGALALVGGTGGAAGTDGSATATFGGDATFTAITLDDGSGASTLTFSGASAQTVSGTIDAVGGADEGTITITGDGGVTFASAIGATNDITSITLSNDATGTSATFQAAVGVDAAAGVVIGDGGGTADTYTATFDSSTASFQVDGTVEGAATDTSAVVVSGGNTVTQADAWGGGTTLDTLTVSGSGTELDANAAVTSTAITIGTGATLDAGAAVTGAVSLSGTLNLTAGGSVTGAVTGASGTLDVDANSSVSGDITNLDAIDIATGATLTAGADVTATTTTLNGTGTMSTTTGQSFTTNVVAAATGDGTLNFLDNGGDGTFTGNIGTSTVSVGALDIQGGNADIVRFTNDVFVDAITVNDADTFWLVGDANQTPQTVSGTITDGIVFVGLNSGAAVNGTFNGVLTSIASSKIFAGATGRFNANATVSGTHTNLGTTKVGVGATLTGDVLTDSGVYSLDANDANGTLEAADFGSLADSGANGTLTAGNLQINVTGQCTAGTVQLLTGINTGAATLTDNSAQCSFAVANNVGNTDVTVTKATLASLGTSTSGNTAVGTTLDGLAGSANTEIDQILDAIAAAPDNTAVNEILEAVQPAGVDGGSVTGALSVSNSSSNVTNARLASLRTGDGITGMTTGNVSQGLRVWTQGFGSTAEQDQRDGVDGFEADSYGVAFGIDSENVLNNGVLGLGFSYADTEVDSDASNNANTEIDSYQLTLYGDYDVDDRTFITGQLAYAWHENDTTRNPLAGLTASGDYDADQFTARASIGRDYQSGNTRLTPSLFGHWTHYDADSYTETGAGGANLTVDSDSINIVELGVAADASWEHQNADGSVVEPSLNVGYRYDFSGDEVTATNTFQGGGNAFRSEGFDPEQHTLNLGAGVNYYTVDNWELSAKLDYEVKEDYDSVGGFLRAGYKF